VPKLVSANFSRISPGLRVRISWLHCGGLAGIPTVANSFVEATVENRQTASRGAHGEVRAALHAGARADKSVRR
jgi:hypothetical protein